MFSSYARSLRHYFTPHHTNNFRAKLLHNSGFLAVLGLYFAVNVFVRLLDSTPFHILGFTSSITIDEVVRLTNEQRLAQGLPPLRYNETLADAARRKAANMFEENYWAHNSPSGKTPWVWFTQAGYNYTNAGENLAKDFGSTDRLLSAWMASPTHKANIISDKFQDLGVAVVPGTLLGQDTVLVVQLFGATTGGSVPVASTPPQISQVTAPETKGVKSDQSIVATPVPTSLPESVPTILELKEFAAPMPTPVPGRLAIFNEFNVKKAVGFFTTSLLILVLLLDVTIAESQKLSRRVGKNWAHILFINVILILVTVVSSGSILP